MKNKKVNIRIVAEKAGVSIATVSRALQDPPSDKISEKQRKHVLDICSAMHYYPNEHTRRMFSRKSKTIALLFPPENNTSGNILGVDINFVSCMNSIQKVLAGNGYGLLLNEFNDTYLRSKLYLRMVRGNAVDGIIIWGASDSHSWIKELEKEDIPVVMLQNVVDNVDFPFVICDDYYGMAEVVKKAIDAGHRKFVFQSAPESSSTGRNRNQAVRDTLKKHGITSFKEISSTHFGYDCGKSAVDSVIGSISEVSCFITANDMAAWGCIDALKAHGLSVPENISVTGADGIPFPGTTKVESFGLPSAEIGQQGAELLLKLINGEKNAPSVTLPVCAVPGNTIRKLT